MIVKTLFTLATTVFIIYSFRKWVGFSWRSIVEFYIYVIVSALYVTYGPINTLFYVGLLNGLFLPSLVKSWFDDRNI